MDQIFSQESTTETQYLYREKLFEEGDDWDLDLWKDLWELDLPNCSIEDFSNKGSKFCAFCSTSHSAQVAMNCVAKNAPEINTYQDALCWFIKHIENNTKFIIKKGLYDHKAYVKLCGKKFGNIEKPKQMKKLNEMMKECPEQIEVPFSMLCKKFLCISAVPKEAERVRANTRSIFLLTFMLHIAQQSFEKAAQVILKHLDSRQTITLGNYERMSKINEQTKLYDPNGKRIKGTTIAKIDMTKWHATHNTWNFLHYLLTRIRRLKNKYRNDVTLEHNTKTYIEWFTMMANIIEKKRININSFYTAFEDGIEMRRAYCEKVDEDTLKRLVLKEEDYKLTEVFKKFDEGWKGINEEGECEQTMSIPIGFNRAIGFCMGFFNQFSTIMTDAVFPHIRREVLSKYKILIGINHSSDDGILTFVDQTKECINYKERVISSFKYFSFVMKFSVGVNVSYKKSGISNPDIQESLSDYTTLYYSNGLWYDVFTRDAKYPISFLDFDKDIDNIESTSEVNATTNKAPIHSNYVAVCDQMYRYNMIYNNLSKNSINRKLYDEFDPQLKFYLSERCYLKFVPLGAMSILKTNIIKLILADKEFRFLNNNKPINILYEEFKRDSNYGTIAEAIQEKEDYKNVNDFTMSSAFRHNEIGNQKFNPKKSVMSPQEIKDYELIGNMFDALMPIESIQKRKNFKFCLNKGGNNKTNVIVNIPKMKRKIETEVDTLDIDQIDIKRMRYGEDLESDDEK